MNQSIQSSVQQDALPMQTYKVVLKGLRSDIPVYTAKMGLSALFKASQEQIDSLLALPEYAVKKALSHEVALKYQQAIERAGGVCELRPDSVPLASIDIDLPPENASAIKSVSQGAGEPILFQGDATLIKSYFKIVEGNAVATAAEFVFVGDKNGEIRLRREDVLSVTEEPHFYFAKKWVVRTRSGNTYRFIAPNKKALHRSMLALSGQVGAANAAPTEPNISEVKNKTAWLAAIGPTLSGVIVFLIGAIVGWNFENLNILGVMQLLIFRLALVYLFLRVDYLSIQSQGFNPVKLGILSPQHGPYYLFSRAKAFGHSRSYAITWCVLFAFEVAYAFM